MEAVSVSLLYSGAKRVGSPSMIASSLSASKVGRVVSFSGAVLHEVMALVQAIEAGADEALMLDVNGMVATCNATNFFIVKNGELLTSTGQYCMNGITRGKVIEVAHESGIPCYQKDFSLFDVYGADEAFVTGTFGGMTPVTHIDGRQIGDGKFGPMTRRVSELYENKIHQYVKEYKAAHS